MAKPSIGAVLCAPAGPIDLFGVDARATPGFEKGQGRRARGARENGRAGLDAPGAALCQGPQGREPQRPVDRRTWGRRYLTINSFEAQLAAGGTRVVKCFLHISAEEQRARLLARLDDPTKSWKYNPGDLEDRALWADYMAAYADALERCGTDAAPSHIVPADRKWYRNWATRSC